MEIVEADELLPKLHFMTCDLLELGCNTGSK